MPARPPDGRRDEVAKAPTLFLGDGIRVRGDTPLNLKAYKIGGLSKMLGMLKMQEDILVHLDLTFGSAPTG